MEWADYDAFFASATDGKKPYHYQRRLAEEQAFPEMLLVPTGAGKTAAVLLAWLWRRHRSETRDLTPRRLVYCLPMRVLVEQTHQVARDCLARLHLLAGETESPNAVRLALALGGEVDDGWVLTPEQDAVIIGTQDMLLSRALNRGYGASRFSWPNLFGLLNNDCLWVMDEIQLMGSGLATSVQLASFRDSLGVYARNATIWMSATASPDWLATVDHCQPSTERVWTVRDRKSVV